MAYFSNSSDGDCFAEQCSRCKYGERPCPIALAQSMYNYEACNNETARGILDMLVKDDGSCVMWTLFKFDFEIDPNQLEMEME